MSAPGADLPEILQGRAAHAAAALRLVRGARHELLLLSDSLERALYGGEDFAEALKSFLLGSERARLCVLLRQPQEAARNAPRLAELGRRLSSRVEFRQPAFQRLGLLDRSCDQHPLADQRALGKPVVNGGR